MCRARVHLLHTSTRINHRRTRPLVQNRLALLHHLASTSSAHSDLLRSISLSQALEFKKGEQRRFATDFAEQLFSKNREPLHLIVDEADMFAPQRPLPDHKRMLGAFEAELGEAANVVCTSGTFGTYLGKLRTLELVTGSRDALQASLTSLTERHHETT